MVTFTKDQGSSPRLRGTRRPDIGRYRRAGIIPALAGNTVSPRIPALRPQDHPRACGEHFQLGWQVLCDAGSSPRLRGTQDHVADRPAFAGIKPIKPSALVFHMPIGFSDSYPQFPHLEHVTCIASTPAAPPATSRLPAHRQAHPPRPALRPSSPSAGRRASPLPRAPAARPLRRARLRRSVR